MYSAMKYTKKSTVINNSKGFTVIELMIATTIFSVVLLVCTFGLIQIGRTYYKGTALVRTQNVTRAAFEDISQAIQYGESIPNRNAPLTSPNNSVCIGNRLYTYYMNTVPVNDTTGLIVQQVDSSCAPIPGTRPRQLLGKNMRLTQFLINKVAGSDYVYAVIIKVNYGDPALSPGPDNNCLSGNGSQFCATSELNTTVRRRL